MVKEAKKHKEKTLVLRYIPEGDLALYGFHDAWGNVEDPNREENDQDWLGERKLSSQVFAASRDAAHGQRADFSVLDWKSKASSRVCRSTFSGETMSCCEAMENLLFLRSLLASMKDGSHGREGGRRSLADRLQEPLRPCSQRRHAKSASRQEACSGPGRPTSDPHEGGPDTVEATARSRRTPDSRATLQASTSLDPNRGSTSGLFN